MLILKHLPISSFNENIAYVHKNCIYFDAKDIKTLAKVEIYGSSRRVFAFLQVTEDERIVRPSELALNNEAFNNINLPVGAKVTVSQVLSLPSTVSIKRKMLGNILSYGEYELIFHDIISRRYSNMEIAAFLVASGSFMSPPEVLSMTEAMVGEKRISWGKDIVVDSHSIGGVPGNKVDLIVMAITAAYGLPMAKTSSRSLTSATGVADVMSVLCNVDLDETTFKKLVRDNNVAVANFESLGIAEASNIMGAVERNIGVTQFEHIAAAILSLKIEAGITHLVFDIPVGLYSRVRNAGEALHLKKLIEYVGDMMSIDVDVVITDGSEPIGAGVGAVLEARDVMKVLLNKDDAPDDLREKALFIAGRVLEFDPKLRGGQGRRVAEEILNSGRALEMMNKIIHSQGKSSQPQLGHLTKDIISTISGTVKNIDNERINAIAVLAGANKYKGAGLDLFKKIGDYVEEGDVLYKVHSINSTDFAFVNSAVEDYDGYAVVSDDFDGDYEEDEDTDNDFEEEDE
ncbi:MAG: thymidine phosphorylase [Lactobacillaceae bacterium]|jgi:thymidine phosphorylase|nr:thymidine phosphorylase [Lactobacillaceae bacterium]